MATLPDTCWIFSFVYPTGFLDTEISHHLTAQPLLCYAGNLAGHDLGQKAVQRDNGLDVSIILSDTQS